MTCDRSVVGLKMYILMGCCAVAVAGDAVAIAFLYAILRFTSLCTQTQHKHMYPTNSG